MYEPLFKITQTSFEVNRNSKFVLLNIKFELALKGFELLH